MGLLDADAPRVRRASTSPTAREAYGFEGVVVDGTDVLAVYREAKRAIEKAREGGGPTLIECLTLRMEGHAVHDDAFYVPKEMFEEWAKRDPIERFRTWLRENAEFTDDEEDEIARRGQEASERRAQARGRERRSPTPRRCSTASTRRPRTSTRPTTSKCPMAEKTYLQAISDGLRQEMRRDKRVFMIGEDVGVYGGAFKVTQGFQEEFGALARDRRPARRDGDRRRLHRRRDHGHAPGRRDAVRRLHLVRVGPPRHRGGEAALPRRDAVPIVVRLPSGGGFSGGPFHSQNPESSFAHIPGLKIVCPATPADAKGLLISAIEDPNPVLYFEHKHLYRRIKGEVPDERYTIPFGKARIHREGDDITVVTWGAMVYTADEAAEQVEAEDGISVEVIDLRTIMPWDKRGRPRVGARRRRRCSSCTRTRAPAVSAARSPRRSPRRHSSISTRR